MYKNSIINLELYSVLNILETCFHFQKDGFKIHDVSNFKNNFNVALLFTDTNLLMFLIHTAKQMIEKLKNNR